ncbi:DUF2073 domain-containing protein [Candidatus Woesearchaeota archaeon]|nr:DUF2073 domain-containing protein [Candidatus Woesearchaeota archaeon]
MLTLQFVPYADIEDLGSARRVKKLLDLVKENKIVLMEGRLKKEEEADLIAITMEEVGDKFKGIELATLDMERKDKNFFRGFRDGLANAILGDRKGFTVIGPATIVKEIKKDPDKIQLFTDEKGLKAIRRKRKKR